jgi:anti-sigma regulatory factor (Ser/Thr protein kinase)
MRGPVTAAPTERGGGAADMDQERDRGGRELLSRRMRMAARPAAVPRSRAIVRGLLRDWQLETMTDEVTLLLSELMTNAVQASHNGARRDQARRPFIVATVRLTATAVLLEVWDANPAPPVVQDVDLTSDCGRGLLMIECMSSTWGHHPHDGGKVVWCELPFPGQA